VTQWSRVRALADARSSNNLGQVVHTHMPLSPRPNSITAYRRRLGHTARFTIVPYPWSRTILCWYLAEGCGNGDQRLVTDPRLGFVRTVRNSSRFLLTLQQVHLRSGGGGHWQLGRPTTTTTWTTRRRRRASQLSDRITPIYTSR